MSQVTRGSADDGTFDAAFGVGRTARAGNSKGENNTIAGVFALLTYAADQARGGNTWPDGYLDESPKTRWDREQGVSWEVILHRNLAKASPKIANTTD